MGKRGSGAPRQPTVGRNLMNQGGTSAGANSDSPAIPTQVMCYVCKRSKPHDQYAKRQLLKFKSTINCPWAPGGRVTKEQKITCMTCSPSQVSELTCCVCGETKGLDAFSKSQRKTPDTARCWVCLQTHTNKEADIITGSASDIYSEASSNENEFNDQKTAKPSKKAPAHGRNEDFDDVDGGIALPVEPGQRVPAKKEEDEWKSVISKPTRDSSLTTRTSENHKPTAGPHNPAIAGSLRQHAPVGQRRRKKWGDEAGIDIPNDENDEWVQYSQKLKEKNTGDVAGITKKKTKAKKIVMQEYNYDSD